MASTIYTHDEAARIVEIFEDVLEQNGISVPSPEDGDRDPDNMIGLYGSTYSDLLDEVEECIIDLVELAKSKPNVVKYEFSGNY